MDAPTASGQQSQASAAFRSEDDHLVAALAGTWQLEHPSPRFEPLVAAALASSAVPAGTIRAIGFDGAALGAWDSSLLIFLREGKSYCESHDCAFDTAGLPTQITDLLSLASAVPELVVEKEPPAPSRVARIGLAGIAAWDAALSAVSFLGELAQPAQNLLGITAERKEAATLHRGSVPEPNRQPSSHAEACHTESGTR